ncbi:MAG: hypothetical protein V4727_12640 [Verrucomicrobiota bacterium]
MKHTPKTYDEWLALSSEERHCVHMEWDTYARDGIAFAYTAAARLAFTSSRKVLNVEIGTYHGGEYLLHMIVSPEDFKDCPPMLQDSFEGFRVVCIPSSHPQPFERSDATLEGSWVSEDGYYEFDFQANDAGLSVVGRIAGNDSTLLVEHSALNGQYLLFSMIDPQSGSYTRHSFRLTSPNSAEDDLTKACIFRRKS